MRTLAVFLVAVNPAAVAASLPRTVSMRVIAIAGLVAAAVATFVAGVSQPILDALDVSSPTFRVAAGAVLGVASLRWVAVGARPIAGARGFAVLTVLLTPQLVAVAVTTGAVDGLAEACGAAVLALLAAGLAAQWRGRRTAMWSWAARFIGLAGVAVALALVVDGVKTV